MLRCKYKSFWHKQDKKVSSANNFFRVKSGTATTAKRINEQLTLPVSVSERKLKLFSPRGKLENYPPFIKINSSMEDVGVLSG